eukprot:TRINITY_DN29146_c0_g1_i2.p1 TRINITY_DN29146_c0_g1~~TRINITY_DN29146_c0_g1_i2.p1  ORF type:complete len:288 (+),score=48.23 TRINITY_DN29146_c0_g1_i2:36-866(+)
MGCGACVAAARNAFGGRGSSERSDEEQPRTPNRRHTGNLVPPPSDSEECPICLTPLREECMKTPCGHYFHKDCLERCFEVPSRGFATQVRCPVCRGSLKVPMPIEACSVSGRRIDVVQVPPIGSLCHFDRAYNFRSLGGFRHHRMLYIMTSNDDRKTPSDEVMWTLTSQMPTRVYLNFRSRGHSRCATWLDSGGWRKDSSMKSTVTTGIPNGPYSGPVYKKEFEAGRIELMGSDCWEGVYFVFVELMGAPSEAVMSAQSQLPVQVAIVGDDYGDSD